MLSTVLTSKKAISVNIAIIGTFVLLRQYAYNYKELAGKIEELEKKYNKQLGDIYEALNLLLEEHKTRGTKQKERLLALGTVTENSTQHNLKVGVTIS